VNTTPLWVPLVVAIVGVLGTVGGAIGGVLITQRRADKREADAWERELERERARWAREDAARTFEQRRAAYTDFYESLGMMMKRVKNHGTGLGGDRVDRLPEGWDTPTFERFTRLELYASPNVAWLAINAWEITRSWGGATRWGKADEEFQEDHGRAEDARTALLDAIREDLGVDRPPADG
jgi:hypothetical protein